MQRKSSVNVTCMPLSIHSYMTCACHMSLSWEIYMVSCRNCHVSVIPKCIRAWDVKFQYKYIDSYCSRLKTETKTRKASIVINYISCHVIAMCRRYPPLRLRSWLTRPWSDHSLNMPAQYGLLASRV